MSKYIRVNGKLYKATDGWSDDVKKQLASAKKILSDINSLLLFITKSHDRADLTLDQAARQIYWQFNIAESRSGAALNEMNKVISALAEIQKAASKL